MDILAARKKAAERLKKKADAVEPPPAAVITEPMPAAVPTAAVASGPIRPMATPEVPVEQRAPEKAIEVPVAIADSVSGPKVLSAEQPPLETGEPASDKEPDDSVVPERETLAVRVGTEDYLVPVEQVREVLKVREATPVPHAPDHITGVISLRGTVLPVIDLARRLKLAAGPRDDRSRIVVVNLDDEDAGLIVDRVAGVVRFLPDAVEAVPETVEYCAGAEYLKGIVRREGKLFILLDLEKAAGK